MASLRETRKKIKTIKSTQQITKAMKMVAAARLRKAQSRILSARPFALKMRDLLTDLAGRLILEEGEDPLQAPHPLLEQRHSNRIGLLLVTADKGLCGSFNTNLIKKTGEFLKDHEGKDVRFFVAGRKGKDFFRRVGFSLTGEYVQIFNQLSYKHAEIIGEDLIKAYLEQELSEVYVIYNEFKSVIQQKLTVEKLLPLRGASGRGSPEAWPPLSRPAQISSEQKIDFIYEPEKPQLLAALLPRYIKSQIYRVLLESFAAELGARMTAMDSASKNASEIIQALTLKLNRTRQAIITREIAELVGGAEALK